jgi:hypothetical protein
MEARSESRRWEAVGRRQVEPSRMMSSEMEGSRWISDQIVFLGNRDRNRIERSSSGSFIVSHKKNRHFLIGT